MERYISTWAFHPDSASPSQLLTQSGVHCFSQLEDFSGTVQYLIPSCSEVDTSIQYRIPNKHRMFPAIKTSRILAFTKFFHSEQPCNRIDPAASLKT